MGHACLHFQFRFSFDLFSPHFVSSFYLIVVFIIKNSVLKMTSILESSISKNCPNCTQSGASGFHGWERYCELFCLTRRDPAKTVIYHNLYESRYFTGTKQLGSMLDNCLFAPVYAFSHVPLASLWKELFDKEFCAILQYPNDANKKVHWPVYFISSSGIYSNFNLF